MSTIYREFEWQSAAPANGDSGAGLAQALVRIISGLKGVERICDLGCGNGYLAGQLAKMKYDVTGVDASQSGIEIARLTYSAPTFICSELDRGLQEKAGSESFDLVISSDVIEHLYRPANLLDAASLLLKPKGQILIGTPYHGFLKNLVLSMAGRMDAHFCALDDGGHIKFFSVRTLSSLVQARGFDELSFNFYGRGPWLWKNMICRARKTI
jgi:2-polyprenyl-3-methyl-5-hydroxy-6-metoxy-1,4-benzoquinol methylase